MQELTKFPELLLDIFGRGSWRHLQSRVVINFWVGLDHDCKDMLGEKRLGVLHGYRVWRQGDDRKYVASRGWAEC
jgi:hypothetical protein